MKLVLDFSKMIGSLWDEQIWSDVGLYKDKMVQWSVHYLVVCLKKKNFVVLLFRVS